MKNSNINYSPSKGSPDHIREYYSGIAITNRGDRTLRTMIDALLDRLRGMLNNGSRTIQTWLTVPIKPLKNAIDRKSNLDHDYYAVNSIDGIIPIRTS